MGNKTLCIIKPDAVRKKYIGDIIKSIVDANFEIIGLKMTRLSKEKASIFYAVHKGKPFYNNLIEYITSGPIVVIALQKENAVEEFRKLLGPTDPNEASEGTLRKKYGENKSINAVHGSDCDENAALELSIMFEKCEMMDCCGM